MSKILVVYYSKSGNTEQVARQIASSCSADIDVIKSTGKGDRGFGFLCTLFATGVQRLSPIEVSDKNPESYDLVVIGTPVWMFKLSSFVRAYLRRHTGKFKKVAFFCTEGGSGHKRVFRQMRKELALNPIATLTVTEPEIKDQSYLKKLAAFTKSLTA